MEERTKGKRKSSERVAKGCKRVEKGWRKGGERVEGGGVSR